MKVVVHEAGLHDRADGKLVLGELRSEFPRMAKIWTDSTYMGMKSGRINWRRGPNELV